MTYYHVGIEIKGTEKIYSKYDITDLGIVISKIIEPYNASKPITLSGKRILAGEIERVSIIRTDLKISEWLDHRYESLPNNVICFFHNEDIFKEQKMNIFDDLIKEQDDKVKKNSIGYSNKIFVVHGHDESMLSDVELFVYKIGFTPIILKNEANCGMTIIEKIEEYSNVPYAIVLYSPCDKGFDVKTPEVIRYRARQNVVFEHGYLISKLTRKRVCALVKGDVETPGDLDGVVYIPFKTGWEKSVVKELTTLGFRLKDDWM